jgi:hypothetical protein
MTIFQAAALRMKWNMLPYASACGHRNLELNDDIGNSMGKYVCIACGICRPPTQASVAEKEEVQFSS